MLDFSRLAFPVLAASVQVTSSVAWAQVPSDVSTAFDAMASTLKASDGFRAKVKLRVVNGTAGKLEEVAGQKYTVSFQRPNKLAFQPDSPSDKALTVICDGTTFMTQVGNGKPITVSAPPTLKRIVSGIPSDARPEETTVLRLLGTIGSDDPASGFLGGVKQARKIGTMMQQGVTCDMFEIVLEKTKLVVGLTANKNPLPTRVNVDTAPGKDGLVVDVAINDWDISPRFRANEFVVPGSAAASAAAGKSPTPTPQATLSPAQRAAEREKIEIDIK